MFQERNNAQAGEDLYVFVCGGFSCVVFVVVLIKGEKSTFIIAMNIT